MSNSGRETVTKLVVVALTLWGFWLMASSEEGLTPGKSCWSGGSGAGERRIPGSTIGKMLTSPAPFSVRVKEKMVR